ncbi:MAG: hypothetical protein JO165_06345, partial [Candidatus Eremiobacteraeota bacterium]|nr:hypothetical protein [Candidatus Eremiobacteraeota bacterium]
MLERARERVELRRMAGFWDIRAVLAAVGAMSVGMGAGFQTSFDDARETAELPNPAQSAPLLRPQPLPSATSTAHGHAPYIVVQKRAQHVSPEPRRVSFDVPKRARNVTPRAEP